MSGYIDDLVKKIIEKTAELDAVVRDVEISASWLSGEPVWSARVSPPARGVRFQHAPTVQGAVQALAREAGAL